MTISVRRPAYKIPEYSLTGDILAHINCGLQYRYHNRASLPPSTPVQLWFGEFLHGVMQEAFLEWREIPERRNFPWGWSDIIRPIELRIARRLRAKGLNPPPNVFCPYDEDHNRPGLCPDDNHPHQLIGSRRTELAINVWGAHLFPLISKSEVKLKGIRNMPKYHEDTSRSNYYAITGRVDVLSSINIDEADPENLIIQAIRDNPEINALIEGSTGSEYEIILDYKGMRRPPTNDPIWNPHAWQILTYAWLRGNQPDSDPVIAGIILYLNELAPSRRGWAYLRREVERGETDVMPPSGDADALFGWVSGSPIPTLSLDYRTARSVRTFPITSNLVDSSLVNFDNQVGIIESGVLDEINGEEILSIWDACGETSSCTACDFKYFCPNPQPSRYDMTVP